MADRIEIKQTPVGRLVSGGPGKGSTTNFENQPLLYKSGDKKGLPRTDYYMALAVEKTNPRVDAFKKQIDDLAVASFPNLFTNGALKEGIDFSFKYVDGDSTKPNKKGNRPCDKKGYPGCWVFSFNTSTLPQCFTKGGVARIQDPKDIKTGYFIRISGNMQSNESTGNPGIYLNPNDVELFAYGEEIINRPDGATLFGDASEEALPAGASATPVEPGQAPPPPATGDVPAPPPAELRMYNYQGKQYTKETLLGMKWTEAQIEANCT